MQKPSDVQIDAIDRAFAAIERVCELMSDEQLFELHRVRAEIFGRFQDNADFPDPALNATALTVREVYMGMVRKREIGDENDKFVKSGMLAPWVESAYFFGQKLVRWNRLMEAQAGDRMLARKGPLTLYPPDEHCRFAIDAMSEWLAPPTND